MQIVILNIFQLCSPLQDTFYQLTFEVLFQAQEASALLFMTWYKIIECVFRIIGTLKINKPSTNDSSTTIYRCHNISYPKR
jgi:hypothetical protein